MKAIWIPLVAALAIACSDSNTGSPADAGATGDVRNTVEDSGDPDLDTSPDAGADLAIADLGGDLPDPIGMPVEGCADQETEALTANELALLDMPADSWMTAADSQLIDVCSQAAEYGDGVYLVQGCKAIVNAWCGGALDTQRQKMVVWGGGHNDYGGNELYAFDLKSFEWQQLTEPSPPPFNKDPLDDGNPVSRHTYDGVEFIAHRGTLLGWGGSRSTDGNGTALTWEFDFDASEWTNLAPERPQFSSPYNFGFAYDPVSEQVFLHSHAKFSSYDFDTNSWTLLEDFGFAPWAGTYNTSDVRTGAVDPVRRLFVSFGGGSAQLFWHIDRAEVVSFEDGEWADVSIPDALRDESAPGLDFDYATGQLVAWAGGAPYALDEASKTWVPRSAEGAPAEATSTGTYGRWRYSTRYNVFVLVNDAQDDVYFYKHSAGCGE